MNHRFVCDKCCVEVYDDNTKCVHKCTNCGGDMRWDLSGQSYARGDYEHISDSLAFHPDDIPAHRKLFPNVEVLPDGRPKFTSIRQQERYAEACGFTKQSQRRHNLGKKRIA
jgi:hypothetical protein